MPQQGLGEVAQHLVADQMAPAVVDLLEVVQVDEGDRQRPAMAGGGIEFLLQHLFQLAAVVHAGQRVAADFLGQAARAILVFIGFLARTRGFLDLPQVAYHQQFARLVQQGLDAGGRRGWHVEHRADFGQGGHHLLGQRQVGRIVQAQARRRLHRGIAMGVFAARCVGTGQPDVGDMAGYGHARIERGIGRGRFAFQDRLAQQRRQVPLPCQPAADRRVVAPQPFALGRQQLGVVGGAFDQPRVVLAQHFQQGQHADVLQQAGQHQFFRLAQAGMLTEQPRRQRRGHAAAPDALAGHRMAALAALRKGKAQREGQGGVEAKYGERL